MSVSLPNKKTVFLKPQLKSDELNKIIDKKKTSLFGSAFRKAKKSDVVVENIKTRYEPYFVIDGRYYADFYRKSEHSIEVDPEVTEIVVGNGVFPANTTKGLWKKIGSKIKEEMGINKKTVDLKYEEHVIVDKTVHTILNDQNEAIDEPYKVTPQMIENYPDDVFKKNSENVKKIRLNDEDVPTMAFGKIKESLGNDVRMVSENMSINQIKIIYVPIFEARCLDEKKKVGLLRIDGISKRIL